MTTFRMESSKISVFLFIYLKIFQNVFGLFIILNSVQLSSRHCKEDLGAVLLKLLGDKMLLNLYTWYWKIELQAFVKRHPVLCIQEHFEYSLGFFFLLGGIVFFHKFHLTKYDVFLMFFIFLTGMKLQLCFLVIFDYIFLWYLTCYT